MTFLRLVGAPVEDMDFFLEFKEGVVHPQGETTEEIDANMAAAGGKLMEYFVGFLAEKRKNADKDDDIIANLIKSEIDGQPLAEFDLVNILFLLMFAGLDTVTSSMSCIFAWLGQHPEERKRLVEDPSLIPAAVEELMRYESPVPAGMRYAEEEIDLGDGLVIKAGEEINAFWAAANVDPTFYDDPLTVELRPRPQGPHGVRQRHAPVPGVTSRASGNAACARRAARPHPELHGRAGRFADLRQHLGADGASGCQLRSLSQRLPALDQGRCRRRCDGPCQLAVRIVATVFLPDPDRLAESPPVVFALPGGGYSRGYYDMHFPGHAGYSQAEHHVDRGFVLVALDHLGVGDSTPEVADVVRIEEIAAANDFAVRTISDRLRTGTAIDGYPAIDVGVRIGIGQSMGGCVTVIMAGRHRTYDAIAVLGYSGIHTVLPMPQDDETVSKSEYFDYSRDTAPDDLSIAESSERLGNFLYPFHWEDVPAAIVEADIGGGFPIRTASPPFGSKTVPSCAVAMLSPGYIAAEAAEVDVPVFIGVGERDVVPEPHREPSAYPNSAEVSLFICNRMAHMHNFATTRHQLWDRLAHWYTAVASEQSLDR